MQASGLISHNISGMSDVPFAAFRVVRIFATQWVAMLALDRIVPHAKRLTDRLVVASVHRAKFHYARAFSSHRSRQRVTETTISVVMKQAPAEFFAVFLATFDLAD